MVNRLVEKGRSNWVMKDGDFCNHVVAGWQTEQNVKQHLSILIGNKRGLFVEHQDGLSHE